MKIKLCTIGCGGHSADVHGPAQRDFAIRHPELVHLAACCDLDAARAAAYANKFGFARHYANAEEMLARERPDALILIVPTHLTARIAIPLLETGIPLMLEKPPGLDTDELNRLMDAASRANTPNLVAFNRRFMPVMTRARGLLDTLDPSALTLHYEQIRFHRDEPDFSTTAIHALDAACFLSGSPLRTVNFNWQFHTCIGSTVAGASINGECHSGTRIHWEIHPVSGMDIERVTLHARDHSMEIRLPTSIKGPPGYLRHWHEGRLAVDETFIPPGQNGFYHETAAFLTALATNSPLPSPALQDCRQSVILMQAFRDRKTGPMLLPDS